jgi:transcription antitermination factor NusG
MGLAAPLGGLILDWGVVTTVPATEAKAAADLISVGFSTYYPRYESVEAVRGRIIKRQRPLFPGYIFFGLIDLWRSVFMSERVIDVIRCDVDKPARLSPSVIDELRERESPDGVIKFETKRRRRFRIGQTVRMKQGSFAGIDGLIEDMSMSGPDRIRVLFDMFGRKTPVTVAETELAA